MKESKTLNVKSDQIAQEETKKKNKMKFAVNKPNAEGRRFSIH